MFKRGSLYSRNDVWEKYYPNQGKRPRGGPWDTGYVREEKELLVFVNICTPGRTEHNYENEFDEKSRILTWFGKNNAHSEQPLFQKVITGKLTPHFFARWDDRSGFLYLGIGGIIDFEDRAKLETGETTIRLIVQIKRIKRKIQKGTGLQKKIAKVLSGRKTLAAGNSWQSGKGNPAPLKNKSASSKSNQKRKIKTGLQRKIAKISVKNKKNVVKKKKVSLRRWTEPEIVVLVAIYGSQEFKAGDDSRPECKSIANAFGRSPATIDRQWRNIRHYLSGQPPKKVGASLKQMAEDMRRDPKPFKTLAQYYCRREGWNLHYLIVI